MTEQAKNEMWVIVELMGHDMTAGVMRPCEIGGLMKIDVPIDEGFRTEFIGPGAVFRIKAVSEEIARVYARQERGVIAYDEPIVPRAQYEDALQKSRNAIRQLEHKIQVLSTRLTGVTSLPEPQKEHQQEGFEYPGDDYMDDIE